MNVIDILPGARFRAAVMMILRLPALGVPTLLLSFAVSLKNES